MSKLENNKFMEKAPEKVIEQFKYQKQEINSSIEKNLVGEIKNFKNWHIVQALQRI